jgi:hypothetical protein
VDPALVRVNRFARGDEMCVLTEISTSRAPAAVVRERFLPRVKCPFIIPALVSREAVWEDRRESEVMDPAWVEMLIVSMLAVMESVM